MPRQPNHVSFVRDRLFQFLARSTQHADVPGKPGANALRLIEHRAVQSDAVLKQLEFCEFLFDGGVARIGNRASNLRTKEFAEFLAGAMQRLTDGCRVEISVVQLQ